MRVLKKISSTEFLLGCGVPYGLIEQLPSLLGAMQPIQFYSCFISYSTKDQDFTQRLYERMQRHHLRVWFAPEDMKGGRKLREEIFRRHLDGHDVEIRKRFALGN